VGHGQAERAAVEGDRGGRVGHVDVDQQVHTVGWVFALNSAVDCDPDFTCRILDAVG
jgi:hypothetical protein